MTIRQLPPAPSRDRPNEFSGEMDAFLASMQGFADDANALEQAMELVGTTGTSTSTLTVGVGSKALTTQAGKAWATGAWVYVFAAAAVSNYMVGRVTSYDTETGALVVNVSAIDGSGSHSSWIIGLATPAADGHLVARDGSRAMTAELPLVGDAVNELGAVPRRQLDAAVAGVQALVGGSNRIVNGTFALNQRAFAGGARAAGQYGHDRWKAGASGVTYTVSGETATITVGTLVQVIEGLNVPEGGTYTLSWTGAAQARIDGGSYAASPITVTGKTAGTNTTIEFGTGTVTRVQYEAGGTAKAYDRRLYPTELLLCQRYFYRRDQGLGGAGNATGQVFQGAITHPVAMRAAPTIAASSVGLANGSSFAVGAPSATLYMAFITVAGAGPAFAQWVIDADAEL